MKSIVRLMIRSCGDAHPEDSDLTCEVPLGTAHADHICGKVIWDNSDFVVSPLPGSASRTEMFRLAKLANLSGTVRR